MRYLELDQDSEWAKTATRGIAVRRSQRPEVGELMPTNFLFDGPEDARVTIMLAHGAGAPMDSASMNAVTKALANAGFRVARFEFGYMAARRTGEEKPPPKAESVMPEYVAAIDDLGPTDGPLIIGGKSMGGRVASMLADQLYDAKRIAGLLCLGYPFHPMGRPDAAAHQALTGMKTPALICQGTRDEMGSRFEVGGYGLVRRDRGAVARGRRPRPQAAQGDLGLHHGAASHRSRKVTEWVSRIAP